MYDRNIYTIVALPNPVPVEKSISENIYMNEISVKQSNKNNKSVENRKKTGVKKLQVKEKASVNELRQRLEIDNLKQSDPDNADIIEDVFMAVEDMNSSEQEQQKKGEAKIQELLDTYKKYPKLKVIDQDLTEVMKKISKAVLCKNKTLLEKLEKEKERLLEERSSFEKIRS